MDHAYHVIVGAVAEPVQVALVAGASTVIAGAMAMVPAVLARRSARRVETAVGDTNGDGTVAEMLGRLLEATGRLVAGQAGQDNRLARLERVQLDHGQVLADHAGRITRVERRDDA